MLQDISRKREKSQKFTWVGNIVEIKTDWFGRVNLKNIGLIFFYLNLYIKVSLKCMAIILVCCVVVIGIQSCCSASLKFEAHLEIDEKVQN